MSFSQAPTYILFFFLFCLIFLYLYSFSSLIFPPLLSVCETMRGAHRHGLVQLKMRQSLLRDGLKESENSSDTGVQWLAMASVAGSLEVGLGILRHYEIKHLKILVPGGALHDPWDKLW